MKPRLRIPLLPCLPLGGLVLAAVSAFAQGSTSAAPPQTTAAAAPVAPAASAALPRADSARAVERCEASVTATLRQLRGPGAQDVRFVPAERNVAPSDDVEIAVRGTGHYRANARAAASHPFSYICSYHVASGATSGVALRETAALEPEPWQPDLSRVSPEACESAVARELTGKNPRVARITLDPDTRRLRPGSDGQLQLTGQGAVQRAPGMNAEPFSYTCDIETRNGQVVATRTNL